MIQEMNKATKQNFNQLNTQEIDNDHQNRSSYQNNNNNNNNWHYGNYIIIGKKSNGQPIFALGPHWYIFLASFLVTVSLFIFLIISLRNQLGNTWILVLSISTSIFAFSFLRIGFSYPGFTRPDSTIPSGRLCQVCQVPKIANSYHCSDCNVCISGYDHHCPWIGKCVGNKNLSAFYFFLIMIFGNLILCFTGTISTAQSQRNKIVNTENKNLKISG